MRAELNTQGVGRDVDIAVEVPKSGSKAAFRGVQKNKSLLFQCPARLPGRDNFLPKVMSWLEEAREGA